jgi:hypothetical protein
VAGFTERARHRALERERETAERESLRERELQRDKDGWREKTYSTCVERETFFKNNFRNKCEMTSEWRGTELCPARMPPDSKWSRSMTK